MGIFDNFFTAANSQPQAPVEPQAQAQAPAPAPIAPPPLPEDNLKTLFVPLPENESKDLTSITTQYNFTPEQLAEVTNKIDYSSYFTPEVKAAIVQGGESAIQATVDLNNSIARDMFAKNLVSTAKLMEHYSSQANSKLDAMMAEKFKSLNADNFIQSNNPALNAPEIKPVVDMVKSQIQTKFPNANQQEINTMLGDYFQRVGGAFGLTKETPQQAQQRQAPVDQDWMSYLNS
jgi:hypothetical protein